MISGSFSILLPNQSVVSNQNTLSMSFLLPHSPRHSTFSLSIHLSLHCSSTSISVSVWDFSRIALQFQKAPSYGLPCQGRPVAMFKGCEVWRCRRAELQLFTLPCHVSLGQSVRPRCSSHLALHTITCPRPLIDQTQKPFNSFFYLHTPCPSWCVCVCVWYMCVCVCACVHTWK